MYRGMVCIAGYDKDHCCIRPVLPVAGIPETSLIQDGQPVIFPFALVEFDLFEKAPDPPHTEDSLFEGGSPFFVRRVEERRKILHWSLFENIADIFEQPVHHDFGFYVMDGEGPRSVGTIRPRGIAKVIYEPGPEGVWDYRLLFYDQARDFYRLKITDLTWHYYCDSLRGPDCDPAKISANLTGLLKTTDVYLRIGLSRGWKKFPDRCYLQINGIYTFPDYLKGKTFADVAPQYN
jgi:hypothetical protein